MELEKAPCEARFSATSPTKNWRFSTSYDSFVVAETFVLRMNICGKNRQLLVAANRYETSVSSPIKNILVGRIPFKVFLGS